MRILGAAVSDHALAGSWGAAAAVRRGPKGLALCLLPLLPPASLVVRHWARY